MGFQMTREFVESIKKRYPVGTRVMCDLMEDPWAPIKPGSKGTVSFVDDIGTVHVKWDDGRGLGLVYGEDRFHVVCD